MNDDLISRQRILDELDRVISIGIKGKDGRTPISAEIFRYFVAAQPSGQPTASPVKFFDNPYTGKQFTTCSRCDGKISPKDIWCKHCGAKMKSED